MKPILLPILLGVFLPFVAAAQTTIQNVTYTSGQNITVQDSTIDADTNVIVASGATVHYEATQSITLGSGFAVQIGGIFRATVVPNPTLTVTNGTPVSATLSSGATQAITADTPPSGYIFDAWVLDSGPGTIANPASASTTFTMGATDATVRATYIDNTDPTVPSSLVSTGHTSTTVDLAWDASTDNSGSVTYAIYRGGSLINTATGLSYNDTGLTPATAYTYTVKAFDAASNYSAASNTVNVTTNSDPNADDDDDGLTNGEELELGTDPDDAADAGDLSLKVHRP